MCVYLVAQLRLTLWIPWTVARQVPLSIGIVQARILEWIAISFSKDLPNPGTEPRFLTLQADSLPSESPGKPIHLKPLHEHTCTLSLKHSQFSCLEGHYYGKDLLCSPYSLQTINSFFFPSLAWLCLLAQYPPRGELSFQITWMHLMESDKNIGILISYSWSVTVTSWDYTHNQLSYEGYRAVISNNSPISSPIGPIYIVK